MAILRIKDENGNITDVPAIKGDKGAKGDKGDPGSNGIDGVSATHSWNGTILTVTSASGTYSADLKGEKGDKGDKGDTGEQGIQGESAVHVGEDEPTDSSLIWLDLGEEQEEVATKAYVDNQIGDIEAVLDGIIAIQNSLIGGEEV